jgi:hypothetical protein
MSADQEARRRHEIHVELEDPAGKSQAEACEAFLASGAPLPAGLTAVGRWHAPGSACGWIVVEGDLTAVARHVAEWAELLEIQVTPVIDDEQAATALSQVYGV